MITNPKLPPRGRNLEVEYNGKRYYAVLTPKTNSEIQELQKENSLLSAQLRAQTERSDFVEDCIAEMAMQVYAE